MKNRFDLEQEITMLYNYSEQLGSITEGILEYDMPKDDIVNAINGLKVMIDLHTQKMLDTMCQCFTLDDYNGMYCDHHEGPNDATQFHE